MMKATLKTRCGAWRHVDIPFPPNPRIIVALPPKQVNFNVSEITLDSTPLMETREFELVSHNGGPNGYADYIER